MPLCLLVPSLSFISCLNMGTRSSTSSLLSCGFANIFSANGPRTLVKITAASPGLRPCPISTIVCNQPEKFLRIASRQTVSIHAALSISNAASCTFSAVDLFSRRGTNEGTKPSVKNRADAMDGTKGKTAAAAENARTRSSRLCRATRVLIYLDRNSCPLSAAVSKYFAVASVARLRTSMGSRLSKQPRITLKISSSRSPRSLSASVASNREIPPNARPSRSCPASISFARKSWKTSRSHASRTVSLDQADGSRTTVTIPVAEPSPTMYISLKTNVVDSCSIFARDALAPDDTRKRPEMIPSWRRRSWMFWYLISSPKHSSAMSVETSPDLAR